LQLFQFFLVPPLPEEDPEGGSIIRDESGDPTGIFIGKFL